ncbi:MAG: helix-turn-helix domain-containing protein [Candidatus Gracilibacteria bacterium]|jgi:excisionase family DNA binding protein
MTTLSPRFTLSREEAAKLLDVSMRTIDRYIRAKKLNARKKGGNILLSDEEVQNLNVAHFQNMHGASPETTDRAHRHIDSTAPKNAQIFDTETGEIEENPVAVVHGAKAAESTREQVFEELYDLSRREIREYHNKLEAANYKLGQIETQLKHSVPLLEYQEKEESIREQEVVITSKVRKQEESLQILESELKGERLNKNIYIGLLFGLLALQPLLWLFLQS